jgi:hypothetical protein
LTYFIKNFIIKYVTTNKNFNYKELIIIINKKYNTSIYSRNKSNRVFNDLKKDLKNKKINENNSIEEIKKSLNDINEK